MSNIVFNDIMKYNISKNEINNKIYYNKKKKCLISQKKYQY